MVCGTGGAVAPGRNVGDTEVMAPYDRLRKEAEVRGVGRGRFLRAAISSGPLGG